MKNVLEEIVRNQHIVLQWRINWIASWMILESSEVKNFLSWRVSTVLKYFLVASACCHLALPYIIRPILRILKFIPKIILQSPEFYRTIFSSRYFSVSKKSVYSFCHWVSLIELSSWFNIHPFSFKNMYCPWRWARSGRSSRFCSSLWSACKRKYFRLRCRSLLLVVVVLVFDQVCDHLIQAMRNSDPRVSIVFVHTFNSDFHSVFTLWVTGCDFQYGSNFGVHSNPTSRVSWFLISWWSILTTCHWRCNLEELVSVFCHEVVSEFNGFQESCINTNLINGSGCESFSTRSLCFCNRCSCVGVSIEGVSVPTAKRGSDWSATTSNSLFLFDSYCTLHTNLRLLRRYWTD